MKTTLTVELILKDKLAERLLSHAQKRGKRPIDVLADVVETVLRDDLIDAVLDDAVTA